MIIGRRSFLTGLLAAPIIVRPGILMPIKPLVLTPLPPPLPFGTMIVHGVDAYGYPMVETISPGQSGQKAYKSINSIEYIGLAGEPFVPQSIERMVPVNLMEGESVTIDRNNFKLI